MSDLAGGPSWKPYGHCWSRGRKKWRRSQGDGPRWSDVIWGQRQSQRIPMARRSCFSAGPRCCRATERNRGSAEGLMGDNEDWVAGVVEGQRRETEEEQRDQHKTTWFGKTLLEIWRGGVRGRLGRTSETEEEQSDLGVVMGQAIILSEIKTKRS